VPFTWQADRADRRGAGGARRGAACAALAVDLLLGEPPHALHPTVWMGRGIGAAKRSQGTRASSPGQAFVEGAMVVGAGVALAAVAAAVLDRATRAPLRQAPRFVRASVEGAILKPAISVRALLAAGHAVELALRAGDLPEARRLLAWHLVSRDTRTLTSSEVAGAAIESLAENLGDGVVAPLAAYVIGGLPAAYAYRLVNTADAMLGYRTPDLEWFGKTAARMDDLMNVVPARLAALLVMFAAPAAGGSPRDALRAALADARRTPSPNAGWPMAAMAGALGVRLDKRVGDGSTAYVLHARGRAPTVADLARARRVVVTAAALAVLAAEAAA
jgi:adenosylcobinamide-phosphate synthase